MIYLFLFAENMANYTLLNVKDKTPFQGFL